MASLNKILLIGNAGKDPEVKALPSGDEVATFSLATSESWKTKTGERKEKVEWHNVEVFGPLAGIVRDYVVKGSQVYIEGQIVTDEWTGKDGTKQRRTKVKLSGPRACLVLLGGKPGTKKAAEPEDDFDPTTVPF